MSDIAPILFVSPARVANSPQPNLLMYPPRLLTVEAVANNSMARDHGITIIVTNSDEAAVRVGPPEIGIVGYTAVEHALAFVAAVLNEINRQLRKSDEKCGRRASVSQWPDR